MKILILSNLPKSYSTVRLRNTARARGHNVRVLSPLKFTLDIKSHSPGLYFNGKPVPKFDAVIPRIGAESNPFGIAVVRQFEQMGVFCLNPSAAITVARDKLRSMQVLSRHQIGIPDSAFVYDRHDIEPALKRIGGAPLIVKLQEGTHGAGVMLIETTNLAKAIIEALHTANRKVLIQRFVSESKGKDIRAFVVGDTVVAAMRRIAKEGEFRSNVHLGAATEPIALSPEFERAALKAAHIMGLRVTGVDLLESSNGPQILEVNSSPGLEGIESATHKDIADSIISFIESQVQFPEIDLNERLSLSRGYSVVELPVTKGSDLINKAISETNLGELEVNILSIVRESIAIPVPRSSEVIKAGDTLLCYGKHLTLKMLLPEKQKRRRTQKTKVLPESIIQEAQCNSEVLPTKESMEEADPTSSSEEPS